MTSLERYFKAQDKIIAEDKEKTLIALGIVEKEYAPDGKSTYLYSKYDYIDGEKRYYREIAANISDEEYAEVLRKKELVEAIQAKERQERERKYANQRANLVKKWVPVFEKPKSEWDDPDKKDVQPTGKSKVAAILSGLAWISLILGAISGIILLFAEPITGGIVIGSVFVESIFLFALAEILNNLAEQTAIMRGGMIYKETNK